MKRVMFAIVAMGLTMALVGCGNHRPPVVTPTPPPEVQTGRPVDFVGGDGLLRVDNGQFRRGGEGDAGKPFARVGGIPCWPTDGTGDILNFYGKPIDYLWPLVSKDWVVGAASKGVNFFHMRPGPVAQENLCCGLEPVGPPILPDGSNNQKFWDKFHEGARATVETHTGLEVDVIDGWIIKHAKAGNVFSPLNMGTVTNVPLAPDVKAWVDKVVFESCNYLNVVYQISNESGLIQGWTPEWERAIQAQIRLAEQQPGCDGAVHLIGSNSQKDDDTGPYDYVVSHNPMEPLQPVYGKPMVVNEYNPALQPATVAGRACEAKARFQGFDYWRSDGSDAFQDQTLDLISAGCTAPPSDGLCPDPRPDKSLLAIQLDCSRQNSCDATPIVKGACEYCREIGMGEMGGIVRCSCPMRNEGDPNRLACEQYVLDRWAPLWVSDGVVTLVDSNGFRARTSGSWIKACNADASVCSDPYSFSSGPAACNVPPLTPLGLDRASTMQQAVRDAQSRLGDVCGQAPEISNYSLAAELESHGICAFRDEDRVMVAVKGERLYEEHHAVYYGNGCWLSNSYRGTFKIPAF